MSVEAAVIKSTSAGGISAFFMSTFSDVEFIALIMAGMVASFTSFVYDFAHKDEPQKLDFKAMTELMKYLFYGVAMMFIVYYAGVMNGNNFVQMPLVAWGFLAMLCAGSAVSIVEYAAPVLGNVLSVLANKKVSK